MLREKNIVFWCPFAIHSRCPINCVFHVLGLSAFETDCADYFRTGWCIPFVSISIFLASRTWANIRKFWWVFCSILNTSTVWSGISIMYWRVSSLLYAWVYVFWELIWLCLSSCLIHYTIYSHAITCCQKLSKYLWEGESATILCWQPAFILSCKITRALTSCTWTWCLHWAFRWL